MSAIVGEGEESETEPATANETTGSRDLVGVPGIGIWTQTVFIWVSPPSWQVVLCLLRTLSIEHL